MSNTQFFVLLGTVLVGVIWQRVDVIQLTSRIDRMGEQMSGRFDRMGDDLRQFYQTLGRHEEAIETLKAKH